MTRYLLDTSVLVDFSKGREPALSRILKMVESGDELGVCATIVGEFYSGLAPQQRARWDDFFEAMRFWAESREAARQAGIWRYEFARKGTPLAITDLLIGAVANEQAAIVVTNNVKDFPMEEVDVLPLKD